jgi:hypothetical protein
VYEGSALTVLGVLKYDSESESFSMTQVDGLVIGGAKEYLNRIKRALKFYENKILNNCLIFLCTSFIASGIFAYLYKKSKVQQKKTKDFLHKIKDHPLQAMPDAAAEDLGIFCTYCMAKPSNLIVQPCMHLTMCVECYKVYSAHFPEGEEAKCIMCREEVHGFILVNYRERV